MRHYILYWISRLKKDGMAIVDFFFSRFNFLLNDSDSENCSRDGVLKLIKTINIVKFHSWNGAWLFIHSNFDCIFNFFYFLYFKGGYLLGCALEVFVFCLVERRYLLLLVARIVLFGAFWCVRMWCNYVYWSFGLVNWIK